MHKRSPWSVRSSRWAKALCALVLVALPILIFRHHVFGYDTYIGNPDRLNSHLKILKFHIDGMAQGGIDAWNQYEMLGFDSFALPYTFPNILTYLTYWLGPEKLFLTAGYISIGLLILAGLAAMAFLGRLTGDLSVSLVGSVLYQCSAWSILSVSQNDMSFAVFVLTPLIALCVHATSHQNRRINYCILSLLLFVLLHFTFLQKAAYCVMFGAAYAMYRSLRDKARAPVCIFAWALVTAMLGASPRLYGVGRAMTQYTRSFVAESLANFSSVYLFQHILPYEFLRWFDNGIFGAFPSDATVAIGNNINLTEGFLLYTSPCVPFLVIVGMVWYRGSWFTLPRMKEDDAAFFFWFLLFTFSVILCRPITYAMYRLFLRIDFVHARVLIAGLLPLTVVVALLLRDLSGPKESHLTVREAIAISVGGGLLAILLVGSVELLASHQRGTWEPMLAMIPVRVSVESLARIGGSALVSAGLMFVLRMSGGYPRLRTLGHRTLCFTIALQAVLGADFQVNGQHTRAPALPFEAGNIHAASRRDFQPPSTLAESTLQKRVEGDRFRSALMCPASVTGSFCAGHVPEFWKLRVVDGYYGFGVPTRLALLPWKSGISLRSIGFRKPEELPWPLLGLLNVKYAVIVSDRFYRNVTDESLPSMGNEVAETVALIGNPSRVVPRFFLARSTVAVPDARAAASLMFDENGSPRDVVATSYVEGLPGQRRFSTEGLMSVSGRGDRITASLSSAQADRFLVFNELYYPGWEAWIDGAPSRIYPTNSFMRGILVPAGSKEVSLHFSPFVRTPAARGLYGAGLALFIIGLVTFRRRRASEAIAAPRSVYPAG
jgi:hypothetical protein